MAKAICLRCGTKKSAPWKKCAQCGNNPVDYADDEVKSVYLSVNRFEEAEDRTRYSKELDDVAKGIRNGISPSFDESELERLREQRVVVQKVPVSAAWKAIFRTFLPGILFLVILFALVFVLRRFG